MKPWIKTLIKTLFSIIAITIILYAGLIFLLAIAWIGKSDFYQTLVVIDVIIVLITVLYFIWKGRHHKKFYTAIGCLLFASFIIIVGLEINGSYHKSIETVSHEVSLLKYRPFEKNTKAVKLNEPSSLTMSSHIPKLDGATALYPLYSAFAQATYLKEEYEKYPHYVGCANTSGAYNRLIEGEVDIIFVAEPSKEQLQAAKDKGVEFKMTPIGREAFVFFVNAKNPINGLSVSEIQNIYSGNSTNWKEFGGKNKEIRAFQRPVNSGSQTMLIKFMGDIPLMTPPKEDVVSGMGGIIKDVAAYKNYDNAIGYSFLYYANEMVADNKIKLLSLNGVAPARENVNNKTYPYASEFYAVTVNTKNPNTERFIEWILSPQGQYLVEKTGYTPLQ